MEDSGRRLLQRAGVSTAPTIEPVAGAELSPVEGWEMVVAVWLSRRFHPLGRKFSFSQKISAYLHDFYTPLKPVHG